MYFVIGVLAMFLVHGSANAQEKKGAPGIPANGKAVWEYIQKEGYSKKWKMWPGTTSMYPGPEPHGAFLTTYVNEPALKAITGKKGKFPPGAMIVQDNYGKDKKLKFIAVMYKVKGYDPQGGDWFWAQYKPNGKIESEGKVEECIKCHAAQKSNDFVFTSKLK